MTIFVQGDDIEEVIIEEMELLDHMLAPESRLERPNLMLLMARYWIPIQDEIREGGVITCTTFPTAIAHIAEGRHSRLSYDTSLFMFRPGVPD
jgi:hypothetical protein